MNIQRINGNGQPYEVGNQSVKIFSKHINELSLELIFSNTGMQFVKKHDYYEATATTERQLVTLLMTYNFKMWNYNNASHPNTIFLKFNHQTLLDSHEEDLQK